MGAEPELRLPGEPESPINPEDVDLWLEVYTELTATLKRVAADRLDQEPLCGG